MNPAPEPPDFSPLAARYARARPSYPAELYTYLVGLLDRRELAWDAATGNGQAARGLADHFPRVIATDVSAEQLAHAARHPSIEYRVAPSEDSGLEAGTVDLVAVAAAVHWFDLDAFGAEVLRVGRAGGVLAAWTYHVGIMQPPFDRLFHRFYFDVVGPHFAPGARLVDGLYATLPLPGRPLPAPELEVRASWNLEQIVDFIHSWSGAVSYREATGRDSVDEIRAELESIWGPPDRVHALAWPLHLRVTRL
jgi:SAM-dependent methyltransferase